MGMKERTKLGLAGDFIGEVMPLLKGQQVLIICNVHRDLTTYELPPWLNGTSRRQKKQGKRIHPEDCTLALSVQHMSCDWQNKRYYGTHR
jgi:hypothetical protein